MNFKDSFKSVVKKIFFLDKKSNLNLVYIHGFSANKDDHPMLKTEAQSCGYKVYSFDLPAHGINKGKTNIKNVNFDMLVKFCVKQIKKMNLKHFVLFGHSMGGALATVIAGEGFFKEQLRGLILEAPLNKGTTVRSWYSLMEAIRLIKEKRTNQKKNGGVVSYIKELREEKKDYMPLLYNIISPNTINRVQDSIKKIDVKTLLLVASKDIFIPCRDTSANYSKYIKNLEVHTIKNAGHLINIDQPNEFYKYFDQFLNEINNPSTKEIKKASKQAKANG